MGRKMKSEAATMSKHGIERRRAVAGVMRRANSGVLNDDINAAAA